MALTKPNTNFFNVLRHNEQGTELMCYLLAKYYDQEILPSTKLEMAYKAGQRSVVKDLIQRSAQ